MVQILLGESDTVVQAVINTIHPIQVLKKYTQGRTVKENVIDNKEEIGGKSNNFNSRTLRGGRLAAVFLSPSLRDPTYTSGSGYGNSSRSGGVGIRSIDGGSGDFQVREPNTILIVDLLLARVIVLGGLVANLRPICPLHRILHQPDDGFAILQLLNVRNVARLQIPTNLFVTIDDSEGLEELEKAPDEIGKRCRFVELELLEDHVRVHGVHVLFAHSTCLTAVGVNADVVEDVFHIQPLRPIVDDPVDTFVEDDEKVGLELVRNLIDPAWVTELRG